jgi:hypothetical protein
MKTMCYNIVDQLVEVYWNTLEVQEFQLLLL